MHLEACCMKMPQSDANRDKRGRDAGGRKPKTGRRINLAPRYSVGLPAGVAREVERYAKVVDTSMSKAITALVRIGLESQENRKREFFKRLKTNLASDDPEQEDRLVDDFRALILGR